MKGISDSAIKELKQMITDFDITVSDSRGKTALELLDLHGGIQ